MNFLIYTLFFVVLTLEVAAGNRNYKLVPDLWSNDSPIIHDFSSTKIVGGNNAIRDEIPWQVSLQWVWRHYWRYPVVGSHYCGGAIVDATHIVTAAHCINYDLKNMLIVAGAHNINDRSEPSQQRVFAIRKSAHPKYNNKTIANDIAVLTLAVPFNFTDQVQPIRLAIKDREPSGSCIASGWGNVDNDKPRTPDFLQRITLTVMPRVPCKKKLPGLLPSMVCAGTSGYQKGTCTGDSGGPLTCFDLPDGQPYLAGAVSWGRSGKCGQVGYPTAFANIANLRPFLDAEIAIS